MKPRLLDISLHVLWLAINLFVMTSLVRHTHADILCYACNSYMSQCQRHTLSDGTDNLFKSRCATKCFTRQGEDEATYRGCFDAFTGVTDLKDDYIGCKNQTWNNKERRWCLCNTDLCNRGSLDTSESYMIRSGHPPPTTLQHTPPTTPPHLEQHRARSVETVWKDTSSQVAVYPTYRPNPPLASAVHITESRPQLPPSNPHIPSSGRQYVESNSNPAASNPFASNPVVSNPVATNPVASNPVASNPVASNPVPPNRGESASQTETIQAKTASDSEQHEPLGQLLMKDKWQVKDHQASNVTKIQDARERSLAVLEVDRRPDLVETSDWHGGTMIVEDNDTQSLDMLEYPYNQEIKQPSEWSIQQDDTAEHVDRTTYSNTDMDYPYNQDRDDLENEHTRVVWKEGVNELEEEEEIPQDFDMALEYPYNQIMGVHTVTHQDGPTQNKTQLYQPHVGAPRVPYHHEILQGPPVQQSESAEKATHIKLAVSSHRQHPDKLSLLQLETKGEPLRFVEVPSRGKLKETLHSNNEEHQVIADHAAPYHAGTKSRSQDQGPRNLEDRRNVGQSRSELAKEGGDSLEFEEVTDPNSRSRGFLSPQLVSQIRCAQTGYYPNPKDCTQFVACLFDPNTRTKVLHLMRCPAGLLWDNERKLCIEVSSTCNDASPEHEYLKLFSHFTVTPDSLSKADSLINKKTKTLDNEV